MQGTENDRRLTIQAFEAIGQETYFLVKENTASVRTLTNLIRFRFEINQLNHKKKMIHDSPYFDF